MRAFWAVCGAMAVVALVGLEAQTDLSGQWDVTLDTHVGESKWTATFEQDGDTLTGQVDIGDREVFPLEGTVTGETMEFVFVLPDLDGDQPINLSGTIDGDTIQGDEGSFSWFGNGAWTGTRSGS